MATTHQHVDAAAEVLDPVCGMTISPADAVGHVEHNGQTYYFCSDHASNASARRRTPFSAVTGSAADGGSWRDIHLPDGSGDPSAATRGVPEVRHGART